MTIGAIALALVVTTYVIHPLPTLEPLFSFVRKNGHVIRLVFRQRIPTSLVRECSARMECAAKLKREPLGRRTAEGCVVLDPATPTLALLALPSAPKA